MADPDTPTDDAAPTPAGPPDHLVELQRLDTEIDQLRHRRERLPEAAALADAEAARAAWERERDRLTGNIDELGAQIVSAEERAAELVAHKERLEAQLKTVIAPREAEALMHEITTLDTERDEVETRELEALEAQTEREAELEGHLAASEETSEAVAAAAAAARSALAELDAEVASLSAARDVAVGLVPAALVTKYDRLRGHHLVAVSQLNGRQCTGCHLDLSAAEVDDAKDEAAASDGIATCPQCGRMLVV